MTVEFVIGVGLGVLHGNTRNHPYIKPHEVDSAQTVKSDIENMVHSAPGIATTHQSAEIHASMLEQAIEQMRRGKEVKIDPDKMEFMTKDTIAKPEIELSLEME
ncbi:unnamed protein product [Linum trigynum]|uniref:Uncharacterized protein n=1 Tax=Linum trigynum TaxID=586398 RepID=A0AAV2G828_9ROSI